KLTAATVAPAGRSQRHLFSSFKESSTRSVCRIAANSVCNGAVSWRSSLSGTILGSFTTTSAPSAEVCLLENAPPSTNEPEQILRMRRNKVLKQFGAIDFFERPQGSLLRCGSPIERRPRGRGPAGALLKTGHARRGVYTRPAPSRFQSSSLGLTLIGVPLCGA